MKPTPSWSSIEPFPNGRLIRRVRPGQPEEVAIHINGDAVAAALAEVFAADSERRAATRPPTHDKAPSECRVLVMPVRDGTS